MEESVKLRYEAGQIARKALMAGAKLIKPGNLLKDVCEATEKYILDNKAELAFPAQVNVNSIAAHYCPELSDAKEFKEGDIVKLDCGSHIQGYVADNALTVDLGTKTELKKASEEALKEAIKLCRIGTKTNEIGKAIEATAIKYAYSPIKNLSGHGIGHYSVHQDPSIPNFDTGNGQELKEGMSIAIEPFITTGEGIVTETEPVGVYLMLQKKPVRSQFAREALKIIETYKGLPFAKRWIQQSMGEAKANFALRELVNAGILRTYGPLVERKNGLVSQSEHSIIIRKGSPLVITEVE